jgi:hypothetical protein
MDRHLAARVGYSERPLRDFGLQDQLDFLATRVEKAHCNARSGRA